MTTAKGVPHIRTARLARYTPGLKNLEASGLDELLLLSLL